MTFSMMVLIGLIMVLAIGNRRRRWNDWRSMDPRFGPAHGDPRLPSRRDADLEGYVETLETRITRLEERLDFTEQLLSERPAKTQIEGHTPDSSSRGQELS